jgi:riboflavin transporter FmnP
VLALVLYLLLGPRAAVAELLAELLLGLVLLGGSGASRVGLVLRLVEAMLPRRSVDA